MARRTQLLAATLLLLSLLALTASAQTYTFKMSRRVAFRFGQSPSFSGSDTLCLSNGMYLFVDQTAAEHALIDESITAVVGQDQYFAFIGASVKQSGNPDDGICPPYNSLGDMFPTLGCVYCWTMGPWRNLVPTSMEGTPFYRGNRPPQILPGAGPQFGAQNLWLTDSTGAQMAPRESMMLFVVLMRWPNMTSPGWSDSQGANGYFYSTAAGKDQTSYVAACNIDEASDPEFTTMAPYVDTRNWAQRNWWIILIIVLVILALLITALIVYCCCCVDRSKHEPIAPMVLRDREDADEEIEEIEEDECDHAGKRGPVTVYPPMPMPMQMPMQAQVPFAGDDEMPMMPQVYAQDDVAVHGDENVMAV